MGGDASFDLDPAGVASSDGRERELARAAANGDTGAYRRSLASAPLLLPYDPADSPAFPGPDRRVAAASGPAFAGGTGAALGTGARTGTGASRKAAIVTIAFALAALVFGLLAAVSLGSPSSADVGCTRPSTETAVACPDPYATAKVLVALMVVCLVGAVVATVVRLGLRATERRRDQAVA